MKEKLSLIFIIFFVCFNYSNAQVGINTQDPDASSILDVVSTDKGILIPRMTTAEKEAISNPATSLLVYDLSLSCYSEFNGTNWRCLNQPDQIRWFYMPSIVIPADSISQTDIRTIDLYDQYKSQFLGTDASVFKSSTDAPSTIPYFPQPTDLYYYVTFYSKDVFDVIDISATGVMQYKVIGTPTDETLINVVFVLK